jgi:RNA polymerase sigma factor (sigma-70 family)
MTPMPTQTDEMLIEQYLTCEPDEADSAFKALVTRHGPMVMGVCRQVTSHHQDAEDAFQATFLTLARKARAIRNRRVVGAWLHAIAHRTASRTRAQSARSRTMVASGVEIAREGGADDYDRSKLRLTVRAELDRLPEKYRTPAIQFYLEGKSCEDAARILGRPVGTIKGQLSRARALLRNRLVHLECYVN